MEGSWTARVRGGACVGGMSAWPWLACVRGVAIVCLVGVRRLEEGESALT